MAKSTSRRSPAPSAPTPAAATASGSDDLMERASDWAAANGRTLAIVGGTIAAVVAGTMLYRANQATRLANASTALYAAQTPLYQGNTDSALTALAGVAERYAGTTAAEQATLLLAQTHFDRGEFEAGMTELTNLSKTASASFRPQVYGLMAAAQEAQGRFAEAAASYQEAANLARTDVDRGLFELSRARMLMSAGNAAEAQPILERLAAGDNPAYAQEARVRLGELLASTR